MIARTGIETVKNPSPPLPPALRQTLQRETIHVTSTGVIHLPLWVCRALLKASGVRSKRYRQQKKAIKKEFMKLLLRAIKAQSE